MNTTREAALEAALKVVAAILQAEKERQGGKPCTGEWSIPALGIRSTVSAALDMAEAALSTPATEPQGYVDDDCRETLSAISSYLGAGMGDDKTTPEQFQQRIEWGVDHHIGAAIIRAAGVVERMSQQRPVPTWGEVRTAILALSPAARPDPQPAADTRVAVKPLVWKPEDAPCTRFKAEALGGHMMIVELDPEAHPGTYSVGVDLGGLCFKFVLAEYDDFPPKYTAPAKFEGIEAAKAAAQADYETRILSALIGTATPAPSDKLVKLMPEILASLKQGGQDMSLVADIAATLNQMGVK